MFYEFFVGRSLKTKVQFHSGHQIIHPHGLPAEETNFDLGVETPALDAKPPGSGLIYFRKDRPTTFEWFPRPSF